MAGPLLRPPRAPAVWPAGVRTGARPATDEETPAGARRIADAAAAAGWEVAVTYAAADGTRSRRVKLAPDPENPRAPKTRLDTVAAVIPSVAVRMLMPARDGGPAGPGERGGRPVRAYRVAVWHDGAFALCWHLDRRRWHRIGAQRLARVLAREATLRPPGNPYHTGRECGEA